MEDIARVQTLLLKEIAGLFPVAVFSGLAAESDVFPQAGGGNTLQCKPLTDPDVRLSRIRLFIITFASIKQTNVDFGIYKRIEFHHFNKSIPCIAFSLASSI